MQLFSVELVHFIIYLSFFFVFYFAWAFYFIPGIYNCLLDKLISPIDFVVTQSPKSQNYGLMGPCSLQTLTKLALTSSTLATLHLVEFFLIWLNFKL